MQPNSSPEVDRVREEHVHFRECHLESIRVILEEVHALLQQQLELLLWSGALVH